MRGRDLGILIGTGTPGEWNAITDVAGVRVGHTTLIHGDGPLRVGEGPVRTGVTVVMPGPAEPWPEPVFAGCHRLNGNGELTGLEWIREAGMLGSPIGLTNTHSVGVVRDALVDEAVKAHASEGAYWSLPVVGETYDGILNDINGFHVRPEHVAAAIADATSGPVAEGSVGGGTGMICHGFKGGIGTASRVVAPDAGGWTVGVLVQANYGRRDLLRVDGVPVGRAIPTTVVPGPWEALRDRVLAAGTPVYGTTAPGSGSIIVVVATDAPLLPHQCDRLAQRAVLGIGRMGGLAATSSGDLIIAFATGNRGLDGLLTDGAAVPAPLDVRVLPERALDPLFEATVEATEESILNALLAASTMTGRDGITAHGLDPERLLAAMGARRGGA